MRDYPLPRRGWPKESPAATYWMQDCAEFDHIISASIGASSRLAGKLRPVVRGRAGALSVHGQHRCRWLVACRLFFVNGGGLPAA